MAPDIHLIVVCIVCLLCHLLKLHIITPQCKSVKTKWKWDRMPSICGAYSLLFFFLTWIACGDSVTFFRLRVPKEALIPLTKRDESKLNSLLRRPYLAHQPDWKTEVRDGKGKRKKPEGEVKYEIVGMRQDSFLFMVVIKHIVRLFP